MISLFVGLLFLAVGAWGLLHAWHEFVYVFKGLMPISLIVAGMVGVIMGLSSKSSTVSKKGHEKT